METFSALLALCVGNSPVTGEFPSQWPVTRSFHVYFDLRLNKRLSKQLWGWWFVTPSGPLWCHCNSSSFYGTNNCWFPLARKWPTWKWTWIWIPYGKIEKKCPRYFRRDSRGNPRDLNIHAALSRRRKSMPPIEVLMKRESMKLVVQQRKFT